MIMMLQMVMIIVWQQIMPLQKLLSCSSAQTPCMRCFLSVAIVVPIHEPQDRPSGAGKATCRQREHPGSSCCLLPQ